MLLWLTISIGLWMSVVDADTKAKDGMQESNQNVPLGRSKRLHGEMRETLRWQKAIVPYIIDKEAMPKRAHYEQVMAIYEGLTCIRMVPWNKGTTKTMYGLDTDKHAKFVKAKGCWTGATSISCCSYKHCVHEIGHLLRFFHEQINPTRDGWIRVNYNDLEPSHRETYKKELVHPWHKDNTHDILSPLHYLPWMYGARTGSVSSLFPELSIHWELYYFFGEVSHFYRCATSAPCEGQDLKCENDGYQTVIGGKCACHCPLGLDPGNACKTPLRKVTTASWPKGQYALLKPKTGCPDGRFFQDGKLTQTGAAGNSMSKSGHMMGDVEGTKSELHFCTSTKSDDVFEEPNFIKDAPQFKEDAAKFNWPIGSFCIYAKRATCPTGFSASSILYSVDTDVVTGQIPEGIYANKMVEIDICCQYRNFPEEQISFPTDKPFYLIRNKGKCQSVTGMRVESESYTIRSKDVIKTDLEEWLGHGNKSLTVPLCYYHAADMDCGGSISLSKSNPEFTIEMSDNGQADLECTWIVSSDKKESTLVLDFEEFNVIKTGKKCVDKVVVGHSRIGHFGLPYCGKKPEHSIRSITDKLLVRFITFGNSKASFKAKIRLTEFADMCYDVSGKRGASYDGSVNYTRTFKPCLPWAQMSECYHHPFVNKEMFSSLEGNACRNPDNSFRPWCYTDKTGCQREYCDVCGIEVPHDKITYCDKLKATGFCTTNATLAVQYCPKTCFNDLPSSKTPVRKYTDITCSTPTPPFDGIIVGKTKSTYRLGDTVQYKCNRGLRVVTSKCMTSRQWSHVGSACLECPAGFTLLDNRCFGLMQDENVKMASFKDATAICKSIGGTLATPRNRKEADLIRKVATNEADIEAWVGINDMEVEGRWVYEDGTIPTWTNWEKSEPDRQDCAVMKLNSKWKDDDCSNSNAVVCEVPKLEPGCVDAVDCMALLKDRPTLCQDMPDFASIYCQESCGLCGDKNTKCSVKNIDSNVLTMTTSESISVGESVSYDCARFTYQTKGDKHQACLPAGELSGQPLQCDECPLGFKMVNNACHGLLAGRVLSFKDAQKECGKLDGFVAMPKSQTENDLISSLGLGEEIWLGLTDSEDERMFVWEDGSSLGWAKWASGEPKKSGKTLDCTVMNRNKHWTNVKCGDNLLTTVCTLPKTGRTMCFDRPNKGVTYSGQATVTDTNGLCGDWATKGKCNINPYKEGMTKYNLVSNYCRNPDGSRRPWCYTTGCYWRVCDVCERSSQPDYDVRDKGKTYKGTAHITVKGEVCANWADKKRCNVNPTKTKYAGLDFEKNYCRNYDNSKWPWCYTDGCKWALCDMALAHPLNATNIMDVRCNPPSIHNGELVSIPREFYKLGDEATFKCKRNKFQVTTKCLTSGDWSSIGTACSECPDGYHLYQNTCYGYVDKELYYDKAVEECGMIGGHLPRPKTLEENEFLKNMNNREPVWLDARRRGGGGYTWGDGTPVKWLTGKGGNFDCGLMDSKGTWKATACDFIPEYLKLICAVPRLVFADCKDYLGSQCTSWLSGNPSMCQEHPDFARRYCVKSCGLCVTGCPVGYKEFKGNCYGFAGQQLNFNDAHNYCQETVGGLIAFPKSSAENFFVFSLTNGTDIWIGANDKSTEGRWVLEDESGMTWNNWEAGEPNDWEGNEDAAVMKRNRKWDDVNMESKQWFVCQTQKERGVN